MLPGLYLKEKLLHNAFWDTEAFFFSGGVRSLAAFDEVFGFGKCPAGLDERVCNKKKTQEEEKKNKIKEKKKETTHATQCGVLVGGVNL